jgi:4a-hydroxytetrahydrobiopterin dehydratase
MALSDKTCIPCRGGVPPLKGQDLKALQEQLPDWDLIEEHHLRKTFEFSSFRESLDFSNRIGELAEEQGHHPEIHISFKKVNLEMWTHKIDGLTESDFVFAAKANQLT